MIIMSVVEKSFRILKEISVGLSVGAVLHRRSSFGYLVASSDEVQSIQEGLCGTKRLKTFGDCLGGSWLD